MHLVRCQLRPEEIGHDEWRADREEVFWREPCERVTHALPDLPAWPVRRSQQSERPGGKHQEAVPRALVATLRGQPADVAHLKTLSFFSVLCPVHRPDQSACTSRRLRSAPCGPRDGLCDLLCRPQPLSPSSGSPARRVSGGSCSSTAARCRPPWRGRP